MKARKDGACVGNAEFSGRKKNVEGNKDAKRVAERETLKSKRKRKFSRALWALRSVEDQTQCGVLLMGRATFTRRSST